MKRRAIASLMMIVFVAACMTGCGGQQKQSEQEALNAIDLRALSLEEITEKGMEEGKVGTVGLPGYWAGWEYSFDAIKEKYGIERPEDPDLSSAEELAVFVAEKDDPTSDLADIGFAFTVTAMEEECIRPFTVSTWDQIPDWAKDPDGYWAVSYTGTSCLVYNDAAIEGDCPTTWRELVYETDIPIAFGVVLTGASSQIGVLSMNFALGGTWDDISPAEEALKYLASQNRLQTLDAQVSDMQTGEVVCMASRFDFNGTAWAAQYNEENIDGFHLTCVIPQDGAVSTGYALCMNKWAAHPYAAALCMEYLFSDEGQIDRAKGGARPIRADYIDIPDDCPVLGNEWYTNVTSPESAQQLNDVCQKISTLWEEEIIPLIE